MSVFVFPLKMNFTNEQINQFCGFVLLNDFGAFVYHCAHCDAELLSGPELEEHVLLEHREDVKRNIQHLFVSDGVFGSTSTSTNDQTPPESIVFEKITNCQREINEDFIIPDSESQKDTGREKTSEVSTSKNGLKSPTTCKRFYCEMCPDLSLRSFGTLKKHMKIHIANKVRKFCDICRRMSYDYEKHMRLKHSFRPYQCAFCEASFGSNGCRMNHLRVHTDERPFLCEACGMSFKSQNTKHKHVLRVHLKKLPHRCKECDKTFLLPSHLQEHIESMHSNDRPFVCETCGKAFSTRKYLRKHKLTHGERKYQCKLCNKLFKTSDTRRWHEKNFHKVV